MTDVPQTYELGPIRPPSEAYSLLIRVTRNCPWNRCKFCHTYKGEKFELRTVDEIKGDIAAARAIYDEIVELSKRPGFDGNLEDAARVCMSASPTIGHYNVALWLSAGGETAFLQDANSLIMPSVGLVEVIRYLKETFPGIKHITSYARSHTAARKTVEELTRLHNAGLSRLHVGMESGCDSLLQFMDKGVTSAEHIKAGKNIVASGISLCEYVVLGLGGEKMWQGHALETAEALNQIVPDFIRVRTLSITDRMPLYQEIQSRNFVLSNDERIAEEERLLIQNLECKTNFVSDHVTNLFDLEGRLPEDKPRMLGVIDTFLAMSEDDRGNYIAGRRTGYYQHLEDMQNPDRRAEVDKIIERYGHGAKRLDDKTVQALMERFI